MIGIFGAYEKVNINPFPFDGTDSKTHLNIWKYQIRSRKPALASNCTDPLIALGAVIIRDSYSPNRRGGIFQSGEIPLPAALSGELIIQYSAGRVDVGLPSDATAEPELSGTCAAFPCSKAGIMRVRPKTSLSSMHPIQPRSEGLEAKFEPHPARFPVLTSSVSYCTVLSLKSCRRKH